VNNLVFVEIDFKNVAVNTIYFYDLEVISIDKWIIIKPTNKSDQELHQQKNLSTLRP